MSLTFSSHSLIKLAISLFLAIFFNQYTSAKVTITGQDETIYVTEDDIYIPASATNYQFYKYVDASFTARHDGNPVPQGLVFTIVSGDPSIIKYVKTTMPNGTSNTVNYFIPEITNKTQFYVKKSAKGGSSSSNSAIGILNTYVSFALTEVPKEPIVLKLYAWLNFMGQPMTTFTGQPMTITIMGGSPQPAFVYGGLKHVAACHYEQSGDSYLQHSATWVSGPIHTIDGTDEVAESEFDPSLHRIVAPDNADNTADGRLEIDRGHWNVSLVVSLHPDNETATHHAITTVEMRDNATNTYSPLTEGGQPVYVQTSPAGTSYTDARHNLPTLKEGEKQGTVDTFTPSYDWTDASSATTSSQFALHMGYRFYDNYVATKRTDGTVAKLVTYVTPKSVGAADAARIASGQGTPSTEYLYKVEQPLYISDKATGVADPVADPSLSTPEYYTIEGVRLPGRPSAPGLYIERRGTTATKIFLRP